MRDAVFRVLDASDPDDRREWLTMWESWPQREVFAHPEYLSLYADGRAGSACCATLRSDGASVLYPFVMRDLRVENFWDDSVGPAVDLISPYGYGGAFAWGEVGAGAGASDFWDGFDEWARRKKVVSEFVRFALFPEILLDYPGTREERLQNVVRSLDLDEDRLWMDFEQKVRKNVKKAQRSGISVERDPTGERLDEFLRVYEATMDRRGADPQYYFPRSYFERLQGGLPGQFMYFHAVLDGEVISTELVLVSAENVYSFLGGTDPRTFSLRPNDLLKYEIIRWAGREGKKRFVLGGGYQKEDGIFRYKLAFAPGGATPYHVGYRIFDPETYEALVRNRVGQTQSDQSGREPPSGYFPAYRA